jgi:hypothetical protein
MSGFKGSAVSFKSESSEGGQVSNIEMGHSIELIFRKNFTFFSFSYIVTVSIEISSIPGNVPVNIMQKEQINGFIWKKETRG